MRKNRLQVVLMGALILQGFALGVPARADHHADSARRHYYEAVKDSNEAACQRAQARAYARSGHGLRSKIKSIQARINEKQARENAIEASEHRAAARHHHRHHWD